jgi:hypothetical protein
MPAYYRPQFYAPRHDAARQPNKPDPGYDLYWLPRLSERPGFDGPGYSRG